MEKNRSFQNLLNGTASEEDVELLKRLLASGEISIGGNVNHSVIIIGSGNTVELPPAALDRLNARPMLGNLDRDLTGEEIASGLRRLDKLLPNRAPVLLPHYKEQVGRLRPTLKTEIKALSETARRERLEALAVINSICVEALDVSFNGLSLGEAAPDYDARSPFRGLESFRPEDSEFFFGREALTRKLVAQIQAHPFLAVLGASGSGKSSLVMAGVIPALDSDYAIFRPGMNPISELESARGKSLIVVDQFEELFTLTRDESTRKDFIARLLDESARARIILTLRSDFLGEVGAYRTLSAEIQNHLEIIPPMDMDELRRAMEGQAGVVGLRFEADLSQQILDDVAGEPGAMPLLQHALWELWNRRHGRNLRASEYRAFGGVKQAITSTAEKVYADCSKPEQDQVRDIFLRLTRLDEGDEGRDTRRRVVLSDLIPSEQDTPSIKLLLEKLANARLIVKTINEDKTEIEVAHEALIRHWERLRLWLNEDRDALRLRESVSEDARRWQNAGRDDALLNHRGGRLDDAVSLSKDAHYGLTDVEQAYLKECVAYQKREQNRRERLRRQITTGLGIGLAIVLVVAIFAGLQWQRAEKESRISLSRELAASSISEITTDPETSILLALQAIATTYSIDGSSTTEAVNALYQSVQSSHVRRTFFGHTGAVTGVAFSPDGMRLATSSADQKAIIWDLKSGHELLSLVGHTDVISGIAFSPNGLYIATSSWDKTSIIWDALSGKKLFVLEGHTGRVRGVAFSPDGKHLATVSDDNTAKIWDVSSGKELMTLTGHKSWVKSVAFSPDGKLLATASDDETAKIWNIDSGKVILTLTGHTYFVSGVAFSPNGKLLATASDDKTAKIWDIATGINVFTLTGHTNALLGVAFSPNGDYLATASVDGTAKIWDINSRAELFSLLGHTNPLNGVTFSPDGLLLASASVDHTAKLWDVSFSHSALVSSVAFSPNGTLIASASDDKTIAVWDTTTGTRQITIKGHTEAIKGVAFSPDGAKLASVGDDRLIKIWDVKSGRDLSTLIGHLQGINSVVFSPNGLMLATGSDDKTARLWDVTSRREILRLDHTNWVAKVVFSPDGKYIATAAGDGVKIQDVLTGRDCLILTTDQVYDVGYSPDGKYLATGELDNKARIWDVSTGNVLQTLYGHTSAVFGVSFDIAGNNLATASWDKTVKIWDIRSGKEFLTLNQAAEVNAVAFSPDGKLLAAAGADKIVHIYQMKLDALIAFATTRVTRSLTSTECQKYLHVDKCPLVPNIP